jgi:phosphatidate cytidylyltransferase
LGGPKLCPKVSPNKTWAGFCGGIILANISFYCLHSLFLQLSSGSAFFRKNDVFGDFSVVQIIILSSIVGDLLESSFKRRIAVKDMGDLFPGHGGVMDRLDSLIFASIVFVLLDFFL